MCSSKPSHDGGKSYGSIAAAAETGAPVTVLTGRGNKEQYEQYRDWCEKHGLRAKVLPSVWRDCETFQGEHGEGAEATVKDWYRHGATGKDIHKDAEYELGRPLTCKGPAGRRCSYKTGWEFDSDEYDVLIGNYLHGHVASATKGRTIVVNEFPGDAFVSTLGGSALVGAVTQFVQGHAAAPLAAFVLLATAENDLGNGWERTTLPYPRGRRARRDAHPTLWELSVGTRLNLRQVLTDSERREYVRDTLQLNLVRTTDAVKPYSGTADHVAVNQDRALLDGIGDEHGEKPSLLTTQTAEEAYREEGVLDDVCDVDHFPMQGLNKYANTRLGAVIGSCNFGDGFVKQWGAFAGEAVAEPDRSSADTRGANLSFGDGIGNDVLRHMREHETLQAVMRFGRDGNGATVYVHTNTLPGWIEDGDDPVLAGEGRVIQTWSDGMRQVLDAASDLDEWTTAEIAGYQVREHLHTLRERGYVAVETEGNGFVWRDDSLHRVNEHGEVEFVPADLDDLTEAESDGLARSNTYTWSTARSSGSRRGSALDSPEAGAAGGTEAVSGDRPPPDEAD